VIWKIKKKVEVEGDIKIKKSFYIFPRCHHNWNTGFTTWCWLEPVYIVYEWSDICGEDCEWVKIGIATTYENAKNKIWE
jgi:hypothetical protein